MTVNVPFYGPSYPLYTGEPFEQRAVPQTVTLAGITYAVDLREYRRGGLNLLNENVQTSREPDDQLFDTRGTWWRYRFNWVGGAGQDVMDLGEEQEPTRFFTSRGVDVWDKHELKLLPKVTVLDTVADANTGSIATSEFLYVHENTTLRRTTDLAAWTSITGLAGTIKFLATDGLSVYVATTTNLYVVTEASAAATLATSAAAPAGGYDCVGFAGNRLLASRLNVLYEVKSTTLDTIITHFQTGFVWTVIFAIGSRIYAGGFAGRVSEMASLQTLSDGSLAIGADVSAPAGRERLRCAVGYAGAALIGTDKGVRFAQLAGDGTLVYGPIITEPGDVRSIAVEGRFAWFGWSEFLDGGSGVGRLDLARQDLLQPAWATDVFTEAVTGTVLGVTRFKNRTQFVVASNAIYTCACPIVDLEWMTEGYLDIGEIYFGAIEAKAITEMMIRFQPLAAGESISTNVVSDLAAELGRGEQAGFGQVELRVNLSGQLANYMTARITLEGPVTSTPTVRAWRASAFPTAPPTEQWLVPLILHENVIVNVGEGDVMSLNQRDQVERLVSFWKDKRVVIYVEGGRQYPVRIDNYEIAPASWDEAGNFYDSTMTVRLYSV